MISSLLGLSSIALVVSLLGLVLVGHRWRRSGLFATLGYAYLIVMPAYVVGDMVWRLPRANLWTGCAVLYLAIVGFGWIKRVWNPAGQAFLATVVTTCATFVVMVAASGLATDRAWALRGADLVLLMLELFAFTLLIVGTHEALDTVCRVRWSRRSQGSDRGDFAPFVSVHVPTHNEPPELVLQTLKALRKLDYPNYEVIVLDNNTDDPALWRPVEEFCRNDSILRFVHLENWPGFKSGALNHGLDICDPRTSIVAVVDADFIVKADYLDRTVGYFRDPAMGFVQTAQGFRSDVDTGFFHRLSLVYQIFDLISLPNRNERNAIIFCGTMGLIRKKALEEAGRWGEWCVTEDAELSLRILGRGYKSQYVERIFGRGVMPLSFAAMKSQRFRWCFGGIQILREHWRLMFSGRGTDHDGTRLYLTPGQRYDYLVAAFSWFQAPLAVVFSILILTAATAQLAGLGVALRPLVGFFLAVPLLLLSTGLLRGAWALKVRLKGTLRDALGAFGILLSLNWAVTLGAVQGLIRREGVFLRTPKFKENDSFRQALKTTRTETPFGLVLAAASVAALAQAPSPANLFVASLAGWSALMFLTAPVTAFVASRAHLESAVMRRRRSLEYERERKPIHRRPVSYALAGTTAALLFLLLGGSVTVGPAQNDLGEMFTLPERDGFRYGAPGPRVGQVLPRQATGPKLESSTPDRGAAGTASRSDASAGRTNGTAGRSVSSDGPVAVSTPAAGGAAPAPRATAAPGPAASPAPQSSAAPRPAPAPAQTPAPRESPPTSRPSPAPQGGKPTSRPGAGP